MTEETPFKDQFTRELIVQRRNPPDLPIPRPEQDKIFKVATEFANNLARLHGIKPFDRKIWVTRKYSGRGWLDILAIMEQTLRLGQMTLMEKRKIRKRQEKPSVGFLIDISGSIYHQGLVRALIFLATMFVEFFGRGFARDFCAATIGSGWPFYIANSTYEDAKRWIVGLKCDEGGTDMISAINKLEQVGFFSRRNVKYVFLLTDGYPEIYAEKGLHIPPNGAFTEPLDEIATKDAITQLVWYMQHRWVQDPTIEYFWIQLSEHGPSMPYFIATCGYRPEESDACPPMTKRDYDSIFGNAPSRPSYAYYPLGEFLWKAWKRGDAFYTDLNNLLNGTGFHKMLDYFLHKFQRRMGSIQ